MIACLLSVDLFQAKKNYATFNERFSAEEGKEDEVVCGAHVRDVITGEEFDVRAKCVVNATGPFTDAIRKMDDPTEKNICQPSSGVHIVLPEYYRYCRLRKHTTPSGLLAKRVQKFHTDDVSLPRSG